LREGFTKRYHITRLVYFETFTDARDAIAREKQLKAWSQAKKIALMRSANPEWRDLQPSTREP
jgi:putative endonuclease